MTTRKTKYTFDKSFMQIINKVTISISNKGISNECISDVCISHTFKKKVTLDVAVKKLEELLSEPLTIEFYNKIYKITDNQNAKVPDHLNIIGDLLNDKKGIISDLIEKDGELVVIID